MTTNNVRNNARIFLSRAVGITFNSNHKNIYPTRNISLSGMYVVGKFWQQQGNLCEISLAERWLDRQFVMTLSGRVTRQETDGIAIQFTEMDQETLSSLQTLLLYESKTPTLMGEEFAQGFSFAISDGFTDDVGPEVTF